MRVDNYGVLARVAGDELIVEGERSRWVYMIIIILWVPFGGGGGELLRIHNNTFMIQPSYGF